jgi:hypothetical protein
MMKRYLTIVFCVAALSLVGCSGGTNILNVQSSFNTHSSNANLDTVTRTIITACAVKSWQPTLDAPGKVIATRRSTGVVAKVEITYTTNSFNIQYLDSDNMGYDGKHISSLYGEWVDALRAEIKSRLSAL